VLKIFANFSIFFRAQIFCLIPKSSFEVEERDRAANPHTAVADDEQLEGEIVGVRSMRGAHVRVFTLLCTSRSSRE
jgi:hypothetical protein